jgi:hypothetical protein
MPPSDARGRTAGLELILACACGLLIVNLYYAQPLAGLISGALDMPARAQACSSACLSSATASAS